MKVFLPILSACLFVTFAAEALANPLMDKSLPELKTIFDSREGRICGGYRLSVEKGRPNEQKKAECAAYAKSIGIDMASLIDPQAWDRYLSLSQAEQCRELAQQGHNPAYLASQGCPTPAPKK